MWEDNEQNTIEMAGPALLASLILSPNKTPLQGKKAILQVWKSASYIKYPQSKMLLTDAGNFPTGVLMTKKVQVINHERLFLNISL